MSYSINEIQDKKENDPWAQVKEHREKLSKQSEKGGEAAGAAAAAQTAPNLAGQAAPPPQTVQSKGDVAGISAEALTETRGAEPSAGGSRVNFGAWESSSKADGISEGRSVSQNKESSPSRTEKQSAGEAAASDAATAAGAAQQGQVVAGVPTAQPSEASASAEKPQTVPEVGRSREATKAKPIEG